MDEIFTDMCVETRQGCDTEADCKLISFDFFFVGFSAQLLSPTVSILGLMRPALSLRRLKDIVVVVNAQFMDGIRWQFDLSFIDRKMRAIRQSYSHFLRDPPFAETGIPSAESLEREWGLENKSEHRPHPKVNLN